ncbi:DUF2867 domain-containing protein [Kribbella sandramycini]|uniref:DUF2867 domain-containing protein n=1 Tax=Kribbella sandramycini TaxID=60450 RepID=A0A7Y4L1M1_9ACTN|nr:DUF2867 domain-containing protein [Kribbella sandramycini]MBB6564978.1 hypothetical protein [Kribbella sandramycini]NOL42673.1 DUF2867 domain-containing protein [Kribbella sandramycini]
MTAVPELDDLLPTAHEVDIKNFRGPATLREFAAGALGYSPAWIKGLFGIRIAVAKALRLDTATVPLASRLRPETVSFTPGDPVSFFTVERGEENHYLLLKVTDNHLVAYLAILTDNDRPEASFTVVTLVQYLRPAGRFYYNLIRPFHHLVVRSMCRAGLKSAAGREQGDRA